MISSDAIAVPPVCDNENEVRARMQEIGRLLMPEPDPGPAEGRSPLEQFAVPYQFQPTLTLAEALVSVFLALLRIFLGSLLFAVWAGYSFLTWNTVQNPWGRAAILVVLLTVFLVALGALLIGINAMGRCRREV